MSNIYLSRVAFDLFPLEVIEACRMSELTVLTKCGYNNRVTFTYCAWLPNISMYPSENLKIYKVLGNPEHIISNKCYPNSINLFFWCVSVLFLLHIFVDKLLTPFLKKKMGMYYLRLNFFYKTLTSFYETQLKRRQISMCLSMGRHCLTIYG